MSDGQGSRHPRGNEPTRNSRGSGTTPKVAATQVAAAQTTAVGPFGLRSHAQVRTHARTHAVLLAVPPLPSRCASWRAVDVTSVCLVSALAPRAAATLLVIATATSRVRTSARKCGRPCCPCGCGLRRSPDAGVTREVARGSRDARAVMSMRARACLEAAPHAARNWGFVRLLLLSAWPGAPAVVFLAFLTRPTEISRENGRPNHHMSTQATPRPPQAPRCGLGAIPQSPNRPKGPGAGIVLIRPHLHTVASAPPSSTARSRRPPAPSTRAARSRCPLA